MRHLGRVTPPDSTASPICCLLHPEGCSAALGLGQDGEVISRALGQLEPTLDPGPGPTQPPVLHAGGQATTFQSPRRPRAGSLEAGVCAEQGSGWLLHVALLGEGGAAWPAPKLFVTDNTDPGDRATWFDVRNHGTGGTGKAGWGWGAGVGVPWGSALGLGWGASILTTSHSRQGPLLLPPAAGETPGREGGGESHTCPAKEQGLGSWGGRVGPWLPVPLTASGPCDSVAGLASWDGSPP